jgi:hypothetical protein
MGPSGRARERARLVLRGLWRAWPKRLAARAILATVVILQPVLAYAPYLEAEHESWDRSERNTRQVVLGDTSERHRPTP